ncbi:hypothetical protein ENSA5_49820 [Enhygromyxa salina]|uniref:Uncharacterized protein n=1 Tax=Enhygromyxa salina TaxID=215803 RepID=A0A2S9XI47_9BACT|nr:hypothetical protein [Enhygromyxa salina]PRP92351.1 hypothetical protein ENSA5_49820 [Enhygromyxa salina]
MTTPRQLLDQLERAEREATGPPAQVRAAIWDRVEAELEAGSPGPTLDDAPLVQPAASPAALKLVGVLALVGLVVGLGLVARDRGSASADRVAAPTQAEADPEPPDATLDLGASAAPTRDLDSATSADPSAATAGPETEGAPAEPELAPNPEPGPEPTRPKPAAEPKTLGDEIALMQALSTALAGKDSRRALKLVAEHERDFADGQFVEERMAARARALCQAGRASAGQRAAERFATRWPASIHRAAVESDCGHEKN